MRHVGLTCLAAGRQALSFFKELLQQNACGSMVRTCEVFSLVWSEDALEVTVEGDLPNQMVSLHKAIVSDERHKNIHKLLLDFLGAKHLRADGKLLMTLAQMNADVFRENPKFKIAIITKNRHMNATIADFRAGLENYGVQKMPDYKVFGTLAAGRAWLY